MRKKHSSKCSETLARTFMMSTLLAIPMQNAFASSDAVQPVAEHAAAVQQTVQQKKVTGKVVDALGQPLIGVTVMEKGTTNGGITDFDGNFSLEVSDKAVL